MISNDGLWAANIRLEPVEATTGVGSRLAEAADGIEGPENGWQVPNTTAQSAIFRCQPAVDAGRVRFWLVFAVAKGSPFREFSFSVTADPMPSARSIWEPLFPTGWDAKEGWVERAHPHLRLLGSGGQEVIRVDAGLSLDRVTAIRLEVWPSPENAGPAVLSELRMERQGRGTTNIALGCPVTASGELGQGQCAEFLTDGLVGSYARPETSTSGPQHYFDVDLRRVHELDHVTLRGRAEAAGTNRFAHLHLQIYEEKPSGESQPAWSGQEQTPDKMQQAGEVKVIRASDGVGTFRGRYLRVFSTSTAPYSPQIAEIEVYESVVAPRVAVQVNGRSLPEATSIQIPAVTGWLAFAPQHPPLRDGLLLGMRWRIGGVEDQWLPANPTSVIECRALPPGEYLFELQLRHTDLEWNSVGLRLPLVVVAPWWRSPWAQLLAALCLAGVTALAAWQLARHRLARRLADLEQKQELARERARIARNMHDVVGSRMTQLAVMHEIVASQSGLPEQAQAQLKELTKTTRTAIAALDEAVWAVNPRNDTLSNVADYLSHTADEYLRPLGIACRQDLPDTWPDREVNSQKRHELFLAFKEALQNLVKHSGASTAMLTLRLAGSKLIVLLDDNGCGLPAAIEGTGKDGLENMRSRLESAGGCCKVEPRQGGGTRVELTMPV